MSDDTSQIKIKSVETISKSETASLIINNISEVFVPHSKDSNNEKVDEKPEIDVKLFTHCQVLCKELSVQKIQKFVPQPEAVTSLTQKEVSACFVCKYCGTLFLDSVRFNTHLVVDHGKRAFSTLQKKLSVPKERKKCVRSLKTKPNILGDAPSISNSSSEKAIKSNIAKQLRNVCETNSSNTFSKIRRKRKKSTPFCENDGIGVVENDLTLSPLFEITKEKERCPSMQPAQCKVCRKYLSSRGDLMKHVRAVHEKVRKYPCRICNRHFAWNSNRKVHELTHSTERIYKCEMCDKRFTTEKYRNRHHQSLHGGKLHRCEICGHTFAHLWGLTIHVRAHTNLKPFSCEQCERKFTTSSDLRKHQVKHTGARPHSCTSCGKQFAYRHSLRHHLLKHTGKYPRCDLCLKTFSSEQSITKHKRIHHSGEKPFQCEICREQFDSLEDHQVHYDKHMKEMAYQCNFCNRGFGVRSNLLKHIYLHIGFKPFECEFCGLKFSRSYHRKNHLKKYHPDKTPGK